MSEREREANRHAFFFSFHSFILFRAFFFFFKSSLYYLPFESSLS